MDPSLLERLKRLVRRPAPGGSVPPPDKPSRTLLDRLKTILPGFGQAPGGAPAPTPAAVDPNAALTSEILRYRIRLAARTRTKAFVSYNGTFRHIAPYSYRRSKKTGEQMLAAYCFLHDEIHTFYLSRFQQFLNTQEPFVVLWDIEIG